MDVENEVLLLSKDLFKLVLYKTYRDIECLGKLGTKNLIHVVMMVNVKDEHSS